MDDRKDKSVSPRKAKELRFTMCVLCGRSGPENRFGPIYATQTSIQKFVGRGRGRNGGGVDWSYKDHSRDPVWLRWMLALVTALHKRLADKLRALGEDPRPLNLPLIDKLAEIEKPREVEKLPEVVKLKFIKRSI